MNERQLRDIRNALVGEAHRDLYVTNVWFHHSLDHLVRFLPALVEGLALQAEEKGAEADKALNELMSAAPLVVTASDSPPEPEESA